MKNKTPGDDKSPKTTTNVDKKDFLQKSSFSKRRVRIKTLSTSLTCQSFLSKLAGLNLSEIDLSNKKTYPAFLEKSELKKKVEAIEYGLSLVLINSVGPNTLTLMGMTPQRLFNFCFDWFYLPQSDKTKYQISLEIKRVLLKLLTENESARKAFEEFFLSYQELYDNFFQYGLEIKENSLPLALIVFDIKCLEQLVCLISHSYVESFWTQLTKDEQELFCKNIIELTRKKGSYIFINSLLNNQDNLTNLKKGYIILEGERIYFAAR